MTTITTHDCIGGDYFDVQAGGRFGKRSNSDRRYWLAWETQGQHLPSDCFPGVMDDFGTLVPVPAPVFSEA